MPSQGEFSLTEVQLGVLLHSLSPSNIFFIILQGLLKNQSLAHLSFKGSGIGDRATEGWMNPIIML